MNKSVTDAIQLLWNNGYEAYLVGGAVRDYLLGKETADFDITTSALPDEIKCVFKNRKVVDTGIKHGTITVFFNNTKLEITTYRKDGKYIDSRHPEKVDYVATLKEDLKRRDFTVNSIAYNPTRKEVIDLFCGKNDLEKKIIRCVGSPEERFREDALRILRALRFSVQLNFSIDEEASCAIHSLRHLISNLSIERINSEILKMLEYDLTDVLNNYFDVFQIIFPHLMNKEELINHLSKIPYKNSLLRFCCFFKQAEKEKLQEIVEKYRLSTTYKKTIIFVCSRNFKVSDNLTSCQNDLKVFDYYDIINYIKFNCIDVDVDRNLKLYEEAFLLPHSVKQLLINGNDLKLIGYKQGKQIKNLLNELLDLVIERKLQNDRKSLIEYSKKVYKK